jgi:hypothetical protein
MRSSLIPAVLVLLIATVASMPAAAQAAFPKLNEVTPDTGKVGDVLTVAGENLEASTVKALFLTDGKTDYKTEITEQTATSIKFKIPADVKPGRFSLMILTGGNDPKLIEQPVKVTVE